MLKKLPLLGFLIGVLSAFILALLFPYFGTAEGPLRTGLTTKIGVFVIFFLQGLGMPSETLKKGLMNWKLHLTTQTYIFVIFPFFSLGLFLVLRNFPLTIEVFSGEIWLGFLYLMILPTTISTAVVLIGQAEGNVSAGIFNTALSNILGIIWVPLVTTFFVSQVGESTLPLAGLMQSIALMLLLPFLIGQLMRPLLKNWAGRNKKVFTKLSNLIIYYMIFVAFAQSFHNEIWADFGPSLMVITCTTVVFLIIFHTGLSYQLGKLFGMNREDRITLVFCGSQKTLATGLPMAGILFIDSGLKMGFILLPLMLYHPLQIIFGGFLAQYFKKIKF